MKLRAIPSILLVAFLAQSPLSWAGEEDARERGEELLVRFGQITKASTWERVHEIAVQFATHHPQGMTLVAGRIYVSSVEAIDRARGIGRGHLFEMDRKGNLLRSLVLGEGPMYHPGGIEYDGQSIWVSVAEYRPDSQSIIYAVDPERMEAREVFRFADHLGAVAHDTESHTLIALSWGSRKFYRWPLVRKDGSWAPEDPHKPEMTLNSNHYIDYQDMQYIRGTNRVLCGGLNRYRIPGVEGGVFALGGIDVVDTVTLLPVHTVPVPLWVNRGLALTNNPFRVLLQERGLRFYFMPEDKRSVIYVYDVDARKK